MTTPFAIAADPPAATDHGKLMQLEREIRTYLLFLGVRHIGTFQGSTAILKRAVELLRPDLSEQVPDIQPDALAEIAEAYHKGGHATDCAQRHAGPCTCGRADIAIALDRVGYHV